MAAGEPRLLLGAAAAVAALLVVTAVPSPVPPPGPAMPAAVPKAPREVAAFVAGCYAAGAEEQARLRALAASDDPLVAGNAVAALGRQGLVLGDPTLLAMLADPRPRVRQELILALGSSGELAAAAHLEPLLRDGDLQARLLAVQALARLGATGPLTGLLADPGTDPWTADFVRGALAAGRAPALVATTAAAPPR